MTPLLWLCALAFPAAIVVAHDFREDVYIKYGSLLTALAIILYFCAIFGCFAKWWPEGLFSEDHNRNLALIKAAAEQQGAQLAKPIDITQIMTGQTNPAAAPQLTLPPKPASDDYFGAKS